MPTNHHALPPHVPPEEFACMQIIFDYQQGRLTLEEAAPRLQAAFRALRSGLNLQVSGKTRRLLAEVARLDGRPFPFTGPDADRHADGGQAMLRDLALKAWQAVTHHPRANEPLRITFHFAAATETTARAIVDWLQGNGQQGVELRSPEEADADDWIIRAATPATRWTHRAIEQWAEMVRAAPLAGEASFMGWACEMSLRFGTPLSNMRLKLAALLLKESLCCLMFEMSAAA